MKKYLLIFTVIFTNHIYAQINLVINPSYEDTVSCPTGPAQINKAIGWDKLITGGGGTPELFHTCCHPNNLCGVPQNTPFAGYQHPKSGLAYIGIQVAANGGNYREYIQSKLNNKLKSGDTYCVNFFVNLYDPSTAIVKPLGAYFDDGSVITYTNFGLAYANAFYQPAIPQVYNTTQVLNDTLNWMKIEGSFVATGTEEYITIGNFFPDSLSQIVSWTTYWGSYYYIDDVSVIPANLPAYAGNDTLIQPGDSVFIGRQPEIGLDEDCIWFVNGVPIDTVAGLWVQPANTTTYIVQQTICGNVQWDTVTVSVDTGVGMAAFELNKRFNVYPNPTTGDIWIMPGTEILGKQAEISINDILGNQIHYETLSISNNTKISAKLRSGTYILTLTINNNNETNIFKTKIIVIN